MEKITELFQIRMVYLQEGKQEKADFVDGLIEKILKLTDLQLSQTLATQEV